MTRLLLGGMGWTDSHQFVMAACAGAAFALALICAGVSL